MAGAKPPLRLVDCSLTLQLHDLLTAGKHGGDKVPSYPRTLVSTTSSRERTSKLVI